MLSSKLFLASAISNVLPELENLAFLEPSQTKVAFVQNAAVPYGDPQKLPWIQSDWQAFCDLEYVVEILDISSFDSSELLSQKIREFDLVHICGGNTLYLNYIFHKTGFHKICKELIDLGELIYTSSSAGSLIVSPNLLSYKDFLLEGIDENKYLPDMSLADYFGLNLITFVILPHNNDVESNKENAKIIQHTFNSPYPTITLNDNQAVWVEDNNFRIVSTN